LKGVLGLGATNQLDLLEPAVLRPERFDEIVEIPLATEADRREIFPVHLRGKPLEPGIDLVELAAGTEGFSATEIAGVCHQAALRAVHGLGPRAGGKVKVLILAADLEEGLAARRQD
jgi:transitional endoplasmic reticulum ATPase